MCRFVTEAHVVYLALHLCGMSDVAGEPAQHIGDRTACLSALSRRIVDEVWQLPSITEVKDALECTVDNTYVTDHWCTCDKGM